MFFIQDDLLYKSSDLSTDDTCERLSQLVLHQSLVNITLNHVHDSSHAGHPGRDRCLAKAKRSYFWLTMRKDIFQHYALCLQCASHSISLANESPSLQYSIPFAPWDSVPVDLLKFPLTENGYQYLLVCVDSFTRFTILVALKDKTATSVGQAIINNIICPYTSSHVILSDNVAEFNNSVLQEICKEFHIKKCNIVLYSLSSNGKVERCNKSILDVLC